MARRNRCLGLIGHAAAVWAAKRDPQFVDVVRRHLRISGLSRGLTPMMNLAEYRRSTTQLSRLPALGRAGRRGHRPQQGWHVPAHRTISRAGSGFCGAGRTRRRRRPAEQRASPARLGLGGLRRGAAACRRPAIPEGYFPDAASALVDAERRAQFEEEGAHYESSYFLTFLYLAARRRAPRAPNACSTRDATAARTQMRARYCAASSTAPTASCSLSKALCPKPLAR